MANLLALTKAIEAAPPGAKDNLGKAWVLLGDHLRNGGASEDEGEQRTTYIHNARVSAADCFVNGLNLIDREATAAAGVWRDLADVLEIGRQQEPEEGDESDDEATAAADAAPAPPPPLAVVIDSMAHSVTTCRCRAVEADNKSGEQWVLLGQRLAAIAAGEATAALPSEDEPEEEDSDAALMADARAIESQALRRVRALWAQATGAPSAPVGEGDAPPPLTAMNCFVMVLNNDVSFTDAWFFVADEMMRIEERQGMQPGTLKARIVGKGFAAWQCLVEGLKRDPKGYAAAWLDLAKAMPPKMDKVLVGNNTGEFTRLQCIIQSLAIDDDNASAWLALGLLMVQSKEAGGGGATAVGAVKHEGTTYRPLECFAKSVELDMGCAEAWVSLAAELRAGGPTTESNNKTRTATINGTPISALECYLAALRINGQLAGAWDALGLELDAAGAGSTVEVTVAPNNVEGDSDAEPEVAEVDALECVKRAILLDPKEGTFWHHLARTMPTGGSVTVGDWQRSQTDCFAAALEHDPDDHETWMDFAEALPRGGVAKVGGRAVGSLRCYAEAVRCNPLNPVAWANVGALIMPGATITIADQLKELSQIDCYVKSLRLDRAQPDVWRNLSSAIIVTHTPNPDVGSDDEGPDGEPLPAHEAVRFVPVDHVDVFGDGVMYTAERCLQTAADLDKTTEA